MAVSRKAHEGAISRRGAVARPTSAMDQHEAYQQGTVIVHAEEYGGAVYVEGQRVMILSAGAAEDAYVLLAILGYARCPALSFTADALWCKGRCVAMMPRWPDSLAEVCALEASAQPITDDAIAEARAHAPLQTILSLHPMENSTTPSLRLVASLACGHVVERYPKTASKRQTRCYECGLATTKRMWRAARYSEFTVNGETL